MWSKENLQYFIEIYRNEECLWKVKSKNYSNRPAKDRAYERILQFVRSFESTATRESVTKKINNIRTVFRKEVKKVEESTKSGNQEIYSPRLWYFSELEFLTDQEEPVSNIVCKIDKDEDFTLESELHISKRVDEKIPESRNIIPLQKSEVYGRKRNVEDVEDDILHSIKKRLKDVNDASTEDRHDLTGKAIAGKLRILPNDQRIHAEKLINIVLFEAELGNLDRECNIQLPQRGSKTISARSTEL